MSDMPTLPLHPEDQVALNALIDSGFNLDEIDPALLPRARRLVDLFGLLETLPTEDADDLLVERTLTMIADSRQRELAERDVAALASPMSPGFQWQDLIAIAAMVLITLSLAMPMLSHNRATAHKVACASNLAVAGAAFTSYARDHQSQLPAVRARSGDPWWNINDFDEQGNTRSNSAHAFVMIRGHYVQPQGLSCPSNQHAPVQVTIKMRDWPNARAISFSYQNQFGTQSGSDRSRWDESQTIAVLADKNPLFSAGRQQAAQPLDAISPNHARLGGQNVLLSNGSVAWMRVPVLPNGDHIYHTRDMKQQYTGTELPVDQHDSFLVP